MLFVGLQLSFNLLQGERFCFYEDLPANSHLRGRFSAQTDVTIPAIALSIYFNKSELFGNVDIAEPENFDILTGQSGQYELCFAAMRIDYHPTAKRLVQFDLEVGELPGVSSDKVSSAYKIKDYAVEVTKEQSYGLTRLENLVNLGTQASRAVFIVGVVCIVIVVSAVTLQAFWLTIQVKKRS